jgi:hypothetical protein
MSPERLAEYHLLSIITWLPVLGALILIFFFHRE